MSRTVGDLTCLALSQTGDANFTSGAGTSDFKIDIDGLYEAKCTGTFTADPTGNCNLNSGVDVNLTAANQVVVNALSFEMKCNLDMNDNVITNVPDPVNADDAANKAYVDLVATGLDLKSACYLASAANLDGSQTTPQVLTGNTNTALVVDGVGDINVGDRILVRQQTASQNNGIYVVTTVGSGATPWVLTRSADADTVNKLTGAATFITDGNTLNGTTWVCVVDSAATLGTDPVPWDQFGQTISYTAGDGLLLTGSVFSVQADATEGTIVVAASGISVDQSADYTWTGSHAFNGATFTVDASTSATLGSSAGAVTIQSTSATATNAVVNITASNTGTGEGRLLALIDDASVISAPLHELYTTTNLTGHDTFLKLSGSGGLVVNANTVTYEDPINNAPASDFFDSTRFVYQQFVQAFTLGSNIAVLTTNTTIPATQAGVPCTILVTVRSVGYQNGGAGPVGLEWQGMFSVAGNGNATAIGNSTLSFFSNPASGVVLAVNVVGPVINWNVTGSAAYWRSTVEVDVAASAAGPP